MSNKNDDENEEKNKKEKEEEIIIDEEFLRNFDPKYRKIETSTINPKSISMGELFGEENEEKKIFEYGIAFYTKKCSYVGNLENSALKF